MSQSQRENQEVGVQFNPEREDISPREEGIHRHVWTGPTRSSYYCAPQVNLERMAEAQAMISIFEPTMDVNDLADRVVNDIGVDDLPQRHVSFCGATCSLGSSYCV